MNTSNHQKSLSADDLIFALDIGTRSIIGMMYPISKEYLVLFNAITDAEKALQLLNEELVRAQQTAEELYIGGEAGAADEMAETPA